MRRIRPLMIILFSFLVLIEGCSSRQARVYHRCAMGTFIEITVISDQDVRRVVEEAFRLVSDLEGKYSVFRDGNVVARINGDAAAGPVAVDAQTYRLLALSKEISFITGGAFDITVEPLMRLWRFQGGLPRGVVPTDEEIDDLLHLVGSDGLLLDGAARTVEFANQTLAIDLSGIAKGYIVDRVRDLFRERGLSDFLINAGGDLYCAGGGRDGRGWRVSIQDPRHPEKTLLSLLVTDKAVATSGDYENFFMKDGRRYSHLIDPRTGRPVAHAGVSATVITDDCAVADAMGTAFMIMGVDESAGLAETLNGLEMIYLCEPRPGKIEVVTSSGAGRYLE